MKTLKDERRDRGWVGVESKYGNYRVVEGALTAPLRAEDGRWDLYVGATRIGMEGDEICLLIPPAKPPHWDKRTPNELWVTLQKAQITRDKYEQALKEIGKAGHYPSSDTWYQLFTQSRRIAKEALDEDNS